ncbi:hypothetical protein LDENG_00254810 [Lucifuga dentata]|nr:hypothetical protein LDENG_00254810 [Lucifuga dentata]
MIGASTLPGDTLIACHYPVVQLPTWQLPVQALCDATKRSGRLSSAGLTRAISLPEQDTLSREYAFTFSRKHFSISYSSLIEDRAEEEGASDSSGRYDSTSSPEEAPQQTSSLMNNYSSGVRGPQRSHNSFLPYRELDEDEEDDDSDGDNLHRYHEDSSFVLHGNSNWSLSNGARNFTMSHKDTMDSVCGNEGVTVGTESDEDWFSNKLNQVDSQHMNCKCFHISRSGITLMACGQQHSDGLKDNMSYFTHSQRKCSPELFSSSHAESVSDSSCSSSDGVLVNFCTIYNRSNNPATPDDLSSPTFSPSHSPEGSVFLNLQPVHQTPSRDFQCGDTTLCSPPKEEVYVMPPAPCWSPQGIDSNCNLCSLEPLPQGLSSLEVSDLTACLQSHATLAMGTNQKYYRLVTCDLSSKSPSPAQPSSFPSYPEGLNRSSPLPASELLFHEDREERQEKEVEKENEDQQKDRRLSSAHCGTGFDSCHCQTCDSQLSSTSMENSLCRKMHKHNIQNLCHTSCSPCRIQDSVSLSQRNTQSIKCQSTSAASARPPVTLHQEHCHMEAVGKGTTLGACSLENPAVRYSKAQRPTSLPIQPFVLIPPDKPQAQSQHLGCLLEQYINHKSSKFSSSQSGFTLKAKGSQSFTNLQPSPMSRRCPILLEAPSSSDTCSTCTPSPEYCSQRHSCNQSSRGQRYINPCTTQIDSSHTCPKPIVVQEQDEIRPHSGKTKTKTDSTSFDPATDQSSLLEVPTCQDLIILMPDHSYTHANTESKNQSPNQSQTHAILSPTPSTLPPLAHTHHFNLQGSLISLTTKQLQSKLPQLGVAPAAESCSSAAPLSSVAGSGLHHQQIQDSVGFSGKLCQSLHSESLILSDRPPTEFCLSPDASYESMSISHLQRRGLLRAVSRAVDLIMAHFGSSRDPEEKMRLGNSSRNPTIAGLVLEHLCPTIQNILEDGLRDHKLDLIIGQRRNHSWSVVEVFTRAGPSTRVLHSLVSKIKQYPQLSSHCMRLRAFIMGLLNLRSLEFWLSHLQSQKDVVMAYYHSWGFFSMSLGQCQPLFQELLLLLQPLSVLPFDLNLLLEPRLLQTRHLHPEEQGVSPPASCSTLLMTSWPQLQADRKVETSRSNQQAIISQQRDHHLQESLSSQNSRYFKQQFREICADLESRSLLSTLRESALMDGGVEGEDYSQNYAEMWSQTHKEQVEKRENREIGTPNASFSPHVRDESHCQGGLRWAKLFGAALDISSRTERISQSHSGVQTKRCGRPSQWLHLDRSQLGLLVQSIRLMKLGGAQTGKD